jgi:hypothetical protein
MAKVGLSKPYYAVYSDGSGTPSYSNGAVMGKATEANIEIDTSSDNNLYADNGVAETDVQFAGGTLTLSTDDLSPEVSAAIMGITPVAVGEITGVTDEDAKELVFDDSQVTPYLGIGFIVKHIVGGVTKWRGIVLAKVIFSVPPDAATTQGETIEWQVPELTGTIMRDDSATHTWKREAMFTTEAQAEAYIKGRLGITTAA